MTDAVTQPTVLVIGDLMLDRTICCEVDRICPEAPVLIGKWQEHGTWATLGGAGNVAANVISLGYDAVLIGGVANDDPRHELTDLCTQIGLPRHLVVGKRGRTTVKTRFVCGQHLLFRFDEEHQPDFDAREIHEVITSAFSTYRVSAVVLSDYGKGFLSSASLVEHIIQSCADVEIPVLVDPYPPRVRSYRNAHVLKPNMREAELCAQHLDLHSARQSVSLCKPLASYLGCRHVVITAGSQGIEWDTDGADEAGRRFPAHTVPVYDVTGAGDTVMAALAIGVAQDRPMQETIRLANAAGAVAVSRPGTVHVAAHEVDHVLRSSPPVYGKIVSPDQLPRIVQEAQDSGLRVGMANGCFDMLHPGHQHLLLLGRGMVDRLVVAINSDASARDLKGEGRPIVPLAERLEALSQLEYVDCVTWFDTPTPEQLIRDARPDALIKGEEYRETRVPGADFLAARGGSVIFVPMLPGYSTTEILEQGTARGEEAE